MSQNLEYDTFYDNTLTLSKTLQDSLTKLLAHGKTPPKFKSIAAEKTALLTKEVAIFSADISNFKENPGSLKSTQLLTTAFNVLEDLGNYLIFLNCAISLLGPILSLQFLQKTQKNSTVIFCHCLDIEKSHILVEEFPILPYKIPNCNIS